MSKPIILQQCQLCDDFAVLKKSHIAPRFMEAYVKSVSLTKQFTHSKDFNADSQSTYVEYFLCHSCEQLFGASESEFARHIFHPWVKEGRVHKGKPDWLEYFLVSLTWRFARYHEHEQAKLHDQCTSCTSPALQVLRDYLLGRSKKPGAYAPQLFYSKVEDCKADDAGAIGGPTPLFDYMLRDYNQMFLIEPNGPGRMIYVKVPHFAIWHVIYGPEILMDGKRILELGAQLADLYAHKQREETTPATRDRRTALLNNRCSVTEVQSFYKTSIGDNVARAQQFLLGPEAT